MSLENFNETNPLFLDKFGKGKDFLYRCIHGDGDLAEEIGLGDSLDSFETINSAESNLTSLNNSFTSIIDSLPVYNMIKNKLDGQKKYEEEITMISKEDMAGERTIKISYKDILNRINSLDSVTDKWSYETNNNLTCNDILPENHFYHPKNCKPSGKLDAFGNIEEFKSYANITSHMDEIIEYADNIRYGKSFRKVIDELKFHYHSYLYNYVDILDFFINSIKRITRLIKRYIGNGNTLSFLNGSFIKINLKILLKYLKYSFGNDLFIFGICLIVIGCFLILSIPSTIILIDIVNNELKEIKGQNEKAPDPNTILIVSNSLSNKRIIKKNFD